MGSWRVVASLGCFPRTYIYTYFFYYTKFLEKPINSPQLTTTLGGDPTQTKGAIMLENERAIFADVYKFYDKHRNAKTDEEWQRVIQEMGRIEKTHNATLCRNLLVAVVDSLPNNK